MTGCKGICDRFPKIHYKKVNYNEGLYCYCKNCNKGYDFKKIKKYRCPCCHGKVRTNNRSRGKKECYLTRI